MVVVWTNVRTLTLCFFGVNIENVLMMCRFRDPFKTTAQKGRFRQSGRYWCFACPLKCDCQHNTVIVVESKHYKNTMRRRFGSKYDPVCSPTVYLGFFLGEKDVFIQKSLANGELLLIFKVDLTPERWNVVLKPSWISMLQ